MQVRGVIRHQVEEDANAALVSGGDQVVVILERTKKRVDRAVVGNVVAEVEHRRRIDGSDPQSIDTKRPRRPIVEIVEVFDDAAQISDAVTVRISKTADVD